MHGPMPRQSRPVDTAPPQATWPPFLTLPRAVAYTGLSKNTINRAVASGALAVYGRPVGRRVFQRSELDRWLASPGPGSAAAAEPSKGPGRRRAAIAERAALTAEERIRRAAAGGERDDR